LATTQELLRLEKELQVNFTRDTWEEYLEVMGALRGKPIKTG
jgi:hypothetical protein